MLGRGSGELVWVADGWEFGGIGGLGGTLLLLGGFDFAGGDAEGFAVIDMELCFGHDMRDDLACL